MAVGSRRARPPTAPHPANIRTASPPMTKLDTRDVVSRPRGPVSTDPSLGPPRTTTTDAPPPSHHPPRQPADDEARHERRGEPAAWTGQHGPEHGPSGDDEELPRRRGDESRDSEDTTLHRARDQVVVAEHDGGE